MNLPKRGFPKIRLASATSSEAADESRGHSFDRGWEESGVPSVAICYHKVYNQFHPPGLIHFKRHWVLDCPFTSNIPTRTGRWNSPWFDRGPGLACLFKPGLRFWEDNSFSPRPLVAAFIVFQGGEALDLNKYVNNGKSFRCFNDRSGRLQRLMRETAFMADEGKDASYWIVTGNLFRITDVLHSSTEAEDGVRLINEPAKAVASDDRRVFVDKVKEFLRSRLADEVAIADLAKRLGSSPSSVSHKYKALTGESPMRTLISMRVEAVKELLARGESLKSIAALTGFYDEFHLSKTFKRLTGRTPSLFWS